MDINKDKDFIDKLKEKVFKFDYLTACIKEKSIIDSFSYKIIFDEPEDKIKPFDKTESIIEKIDYWGESIDEESTYSQSQGVCTFSKNYNQDNTLTIISDNNNSQDLFEKIINRVRNEPRTLIENTVLTNSVSSTDDNNSDTLSIISSSQYSDISCNSIQSNILLSKKIITASQSAPKTINSFQKGNWAFLTGSSAGHANFNAHITKELEKVQEYHSNEGNVFEALAYRKAIGQIKKYPKKITECSEVSKLKCVGVKIGEKIKEILLTGKCKKSAFVSNDSKNKIINTLMQIYGVGIKQANEFYRKGITTIDQLKKISSELPANIQKGLEYYNDIQIKIPRKEVKEIFEKVKEELLTILPEEVINAEVCGSYRRGKDLCGDIDILITRNDEGMIDGIIQTLVEKLMAKKVIVDILSLGGGKGDNKNVFMGLCMGRSGINRRIDIKVYTKEEFPFAVLYFTGNAYFNRSMRLFAKKKKMHLSDKELSYRSTGKKIECKTEEEIFKALGIAYKSPNEREV